MPGPTLHCAPILLYATTHLRATDPAFAVLIDRIGPCTFQAKPREPYEALIRAIAHQQLHGKAAEAILARFMALFPPPFPAPDAVLATPDEPIRACGFSASKILAIRDICTHTQGGRVPTSTEAAALDDATLIDRLITIRGVGRWTVEIFLIATLGRPDVLPVDDFGVREGWRLIKGFDKQPKPRELAELGTAWSPHRSTAAWYLWRASDEGKKVKQPPV